MSDPIDDRDRAHLIQVADALKAEAAVLRVQSITDKNNIDALVLELERMRSSNRVMIDEETSSLLTEAAAILDMARKVAIDEGILNEEDFEGDDLSDRCRAMADKIQSTFDTEHQRERSSARPALSYEPDGEDDQDGPGLSEIGVRPLGPSLAPAPAHERLANILGAGLPDGEAYARLRAWRDTAEARDRFPTQAARDAYLDGWREARAAARFETRRPTIADIAEVAREHPEDAAAFCDAVQASAPTDEERVICSTCRKPKPNDEEQRQMDEHVGECSDDSCNGTSRLLQLCWPWSCRHTCATVGGETAYRAWDGDMLILHQCSDKAERGRFDSGGRFHYEGNCTPIPGASNWCGAPPPHTEAP